MQVSQRKQKGLSLVETMIALTLGAIVTVGVIQLFVANSETYNLMQGQSRMQESARFALNFLRRGVEMAGYKGCFSRTNHVYAVMTDPANDMPYEFNVARGVEGYEYSISDWSPTLDELPDTVADDSFISGNGVPINDVIPGTDVLTIRRTSSTEADLATDMPTSTEDVDVTTPVSGLEFVNVQRGAAGCAEGTEKICLGDLILIHDCEKSTTFRVTSLSAAGGQTTIGHSTTGGDPIDNDLQKLAEVNTYGTDAAVSAIQTNIFYIAPGAGVNNQGDHPFSLWRKSGTDAPVELVEGVEDLQLLFGVDTDNDGTPNVYRTADSVTDYGDVATIRISITVNSIDDVGATTAPTHGCVVDGGQQPCLTGESYDGLLRRTFHQTVELRNKG